MRREAIYPHRSVRSLPLSAGRLLAGLIAATTMTVLIYFLSSRLLEIHNEIATSLLKLCRIPIATLAAVDLFAPLGQTQAAITEAFHSKDDPARIAIFFVGSISILLTLHRRVELARNFLVFLMILILTAAGVLLFNPAFEIDPRTFTQIWLRGEILVWLLLPWFSAGLYTLLQPTAWRGLIWALAVQGYGFVWSAVRLAYCLAIIYYSGPLFTLLLWFGLGLLADVLYLIVFFSLLTRPAAVKLGEAVGMAILILIAKSCLYFAIAVLSLYAIRHYIFTFCRISLHRPRDMRELAGFVTPRISVLVPMHNEEKVASDVLQALVECDYDWSRLEVLAINDNSTDRTGEIIDEFAAKYPIIKTLHRNGGSGGKGGALQEATRNATGEILPLFDADYFPGRSMLKMLVTPFCDPQVGASMGRVIPHNTGASILSALLGLERAAGYQIGQQARFNLGFTPQFGGTVGGVRASALRSVGGWNSASLTEDTDLTFRLVINGWKISYVNRAECYEEAPESWPVRNKQIARWAVGHTDCLHQLWPKLLASRHLSPIEKIDALFVLGCYWTAPILALGWVASIALFLITRAHQGPEFAVALALVGYQLFGSQATFYEIGAAAVLDGNTRGVHLIPLSLFNFFASTGAICTALLRYYIGRIFGSSGPGWHKTARYRQNGNGQMFRNGGHAIFIQGGNGLYTRSMEKPH